GIDLQHMPYEGANPAVAALLGGHIEATLTGFTEVTGQYKSGQVKILGVTTDKRIQEFMPDVPTFKELGHDFVAGFWMGVFAPKDTPQEIVGILSDAVKKASESEEFKNACKKLYLLNAYLGPDEFSASIARDAESNQKMLQEMGIAKK
ncbi:MAG: Bug family tripartite tricarboxylate transporter substrate binding protein, partial [Bacillota bacterium]